MLLSPSTTLLLIASLFFVRAGAAATQAPGVPVTKQEQSLLPPLADPTKSLCPISYVDGKQIIPASNTPMDCYKDLREKAKVRKAQAVELAAKAIKLAETTQQSSAPKCVKSVDLREMACIKTKLLNNLKTKPTYAVTGEDNKVFVFKDGKKIMEAVAIQSHFVKQEKPPSDQSKIIDKAKEAYVFNAIGEVLTTKQQRKKKAVECICPGQGIPPTSEGSTMVNKCIVQQCKNYDLFVNILSNTSVSEGQTGDNKPAEKGKTDEKKEVKKDDKTAAPAA
ncbi:hypothetical protein NGRA_2066 [Nosema granulosis]|uniref:Polar tube protein 2 n=1 Tax=Nosema granulosis TaxID=83296 RepID=A0A9P6KYZ9_9MICR|nr:hypothetical protein NGRA_2066 [Nosema granulosis]